MSLTAVGEHWDVALLISSGDAVKVDGGSAWVGGVDGSGGNGGGSLVVGNTDCCRLDRLLLMGGDLYGRIKVPSLILCNMACGTMTPN
jgi:hypothetical protein